MIRPIPTAFVLALLAVPAWSQFAPEEILAARSDPRTFAVDEAAIRIERVEPDAELGAFRSPSRNAGGADAAEIVNVGEKIWRIIEDNRPVVDVKTQYAAALPKGAPAWQKMAGWKQPAGVVYELTAKNAYGIDVIDVRYQVLRTYGGSYDGKGKYLTAVTVQPLSIETAWGYRFTMEASVPDASIVNVGTARDPVAGMMATLGWRISTALKETQGQSLYFLQGDGAYKEITGPFE